jgi:hypothetical protein
MFFWTWDIDTVGHLLEYTIAVYTSKPSLAELIIVNAELSRLFNECIREEPSSSMQEELRAQAKQCEENLRLLIARLPFSLTATFDNILAFYHIVSVLLAVCFTYLLMCSKTIHMLTSCKPIAAWKYIAASTQMCQTLGYHRERALISESAQQRRRRKRLVWMIVIMDKSLSLRLGRASSIRDGDFTLEKTMDLTQDDVSAFSYMTLLPKWIDLALLQGQAYDDIFSPRALQQPEGIRVARARALATDLQKVYETMSPVESHVLELRRRAIGNEMHELFLRADNISHLSTLTLVYRAIPGIYSNSVFCHECVSTAAEALKEHQKCLAMLKKVDGNILQMYVEWLVFLLPMIMFSQLTPSRALLSAPFIPFVVLFCRTLETSSSEYLETLSSVVETLSLLPPDLPTAYKVQLKVFKAMYKVACDYINANGKKQLMGQTFPGFSLDRPLAGMDGAAGSTSSFSMMHHVQNDGQGAMIPFSTLGGVHLNSSEEVNIGIETGDSGAELGLWLDQNQRMFGMFEDMF